MHTHSFTILYQKTELQWK